MKLFWVFAAFALIVFGTRSFINDAKQSSNSGSELPLKVASQPETKMNGTINNENVLEIPVGLEETKLLVGLDSIRIEKDGIRYGEIGSSIKKSIGTTVNIYTVIKSSYFDCVKKQVKVTEGIFISQKSEKPLEKGQYLGSEIGKGFQDVTGNSLQEFELTLMCDLSEKDFQKIQNPDGKTIKNDVKDA